MRALTAPLRFQREQYEHSQGVLGSLFRRLPALESVVWLEPQAHLSGRSLCDEFEVKLTSSPDPWSPREFKPGSSTRELLEALYFYSLEDWE